jgi:hypothetical protein
MKSREIKTEKISVVEGLTCSISSRRSKLRCKTLLGGFRGCLATPLTPPMRHLPNGVCPFKTEGAVIESGKLGGLLTKELLFFANGHAGKTKATRKKRSGLRYTNQLYLIAFLGTLTYPALCHPVRFDQTFFSHSDDLWQLQEEEQE